MRNFYAAFHDAWPYWLYFCTLGEDGLKGMVFCCLKTLMAIQVEGKDTCTIEPDPAELIRFLKADFVHMKAIGERGQMFENLMEERKKMIWEYFGLGGIAME